MIDLDIGKLILLALIALVVLGPEKLPVAARTAGAIVRRMRGGWNSVRAEVERELQIAEIRQAARDTSKHVASAQAGLNATLVPLREPLNSQSLNMLMQSTPSLDPAPPNSSGRMSSAKVSAAAPPSELSAHGNTAEDVVHDIA